jgi:hypothetical protein
MAGLSSNLDRFSSPLASERVLPFHMDQMIQEQQELNKDRPNRPIYLYLLE